MRRVLPLLLLALVVTGCQLRLATDIQVGEDGSGRIALAVELDEELHASLTADGFEPFQGLAEPAQPWEATVSADGRRLDLGAAFDRPEALSQLVADLQSGLDVSDPVLLEDVELTVDDGRVTFDARAGLRPPASTGAEGPGIAFDGEDLTDALAERGDDLVRYDLRIVLPGAIVESDADAVDGREAVWNLPVTDLRAVRAVSDPPSQDPPWLVIGGAGLAGLAVGLLAVWAIRRRGARA